MTYTEMNTFINLLTVPSDNSDFMSDPYQHIGWALNAMASGSCPELYSPNTGSQYCTSLCMNTCPELNPSYVAGLRQMISQNQTLINLITSALGKANSVQNAKSSLIYVTGTVAFPIPSNATQMAVQNVTGRIMTDLSRHYPSSLNATVCDDLNFL